MKLEHVAFNVTDPVAVAAWYCTHLGLTVAKHVPEPVQTHFLHDGSTSVLEFYSNPAGRIPDYFAQDPLQLHVAFITTDPEGDIKRLVGAGATLVSDSTAPDGTRLVMLRDPWGLAVQLCRRGAPLL